MVILNVNLNGGKTPANGAGEKQVSVLLSLVTAREKWDGSFCRGGNTKHKTNTQTLTEIILILICTNGQPCEQTQLCLEVL